MVDGNRDLPTVVLIAGATGSGKSRLAMELARARGGVVINADSMQVYRELRVLTARPSVADEKLCEHRLYGHVGLEQAYSVGMWLEDASKAIAQVREAGRMPIVVGGTGLYFKALLDGLAPVPVIPIGVRERWRVEAAGVAVEELHAILQERDGQMAERLRPSDRQRILRALEVHDGTGRSLADWQAVDSDPFLGPGTYKGMVVDRPRSETYAACENRLDLMVADGALEEAAMVRDMQLDVTLPGMRALGLGALIRHMNGQLTLEDALVEAKLDTRHYVKRQLTWLRRNMITWKCVFAEDMESMVLNSFSFIDD